MITIAFHKILKLEKTMIQFISINKKILVGMLIGIMLGYIHWYYWGCYWGVCPMSSECWMNCLIGTLFGGFIVSLADGENL